MARLWKLKATTIVMWSALAPESSPAATLPRQARPELSGDAGKGTAKNKYIICMICMICIICIICILRGHLVILDQAEPLFVAIWAQEHTPISKIMVGLGMSNLIFEGRVSSNTFWNSARA